MNADSTKTKVLVLTYASRGLRGLLTAFRKPPQITTYPKFERNFIVYAYIMFTKLFMSIFYELAMTDDFSPHLSTS